MLPFWLRSVLLIVTDDAPLPLACQIPWLLFAIIELVMNPLGTPPKINIPAPVPALLEIVLLVILNGVFPISMPCSVALFRKVQLVILRATDAFEKIMLLLSAAPALGPVLP